MMGAMWWIPAALAYDPVPEAVGVHLSAGGLERLGDAVAAVMPAAFPIGATSGEMVCDDADPTQVLTWSVEAFDVELDIQEVALVPADGTLTLSLYGALSSSPSTVQATGDCAPLADLAETCSLELPTVPLEVHLPISLTLVEGVADATIGSAELTIGPIGNPLDGCVLADAIGTLLGTDPEAVTNLLTDAIAPSLEDLGATLEPTLDDALAGLSLETALALGEGEVALALAPTTLTVDEEGVFIGLGATVTPSVVSDCVPAATAPAGEGAWPVLDGVAPDGALTYDAAALVAQPFVDQILFAAYEGGALCQDVAELSGAALGTSLFAPLFGEPWEALFPSEVPLLIEVRPATPPTATFATDGAPLRLNLDGLNIAAWAELDGRQARIFGVTLKGSVGLDLPLTDGVLTPTIVIDDALELVEDDHELLPAGYAAGLSDFLPGLIAGALPELPSITIPSWRGIGLEWIWWIPTEGFLGGWATLDVDDVEPIELSGCEGGTIGCDDGLSTGDIDLGAELGCDEATSCDSGCEGGGSCGLPHPGARLLPLLIGALTPLLRRR